MLEQDVGALPCCKDSILVPSPGCHFPYLKNFEGIEEENF